MEITPGGLRGGAKGWAWCQDTPDLNRPLAGNQTSTKAASLQANGRYFCSTRSFGSAALLQYSAEGYLHELEAPQLPPRSYRRHMFPLEGHELKYQRRHRFYILRIKQGDYDQEELGCNCSYSKGVKVI